MSKSPIGWLRSTKSVVLLGLETAGKTTLLNQWARGIASKTTTTIGLDIEHVEVGSEIFNLIDLGGQQAFRVTLWKTYAQMAEGVVFVFDITDKERTKEAIKWFWQVEQWVKSGIPIMFCANKIDLKKERGGDKEAMSLEEIITTFDLKRFGTDLKSEHSFRIFEISALTGENVIEAMDWLFNRIQRKSDTPQIGKLIITKNDGTKVIEMSPAEEQGVAVDNEEIQNIIDMNVGIVPKFDAIQFYESETSIRILLVRSDHLMVISTEKEADYNAIRIMAETIMTLFLIQQTEGVFDEKAFKEVIQDFFKSYK